VIALKLDKRLAKVEFDHLFTMDRVLGKAPGIRMFGRRSRVVGHRAGSNG